MSSTALQRAVLTQSSPMPKRADPGPMPTHFVTDDDKHWMRARLEETKIGVAKLAKICGVSRQAMYGVRDGDVRNITYWPLIVRALGGDGGKTASANDARLQEIIRRWPELSEDDHVLLETTARRLSRKP